MKKNIFFTIFLSGILATSCSDGIINDEDINYSNEIAMSRSISPNVSTYSVSEYLVQKFIRLTAPAKTVQDITPVVRNTVDTLAYIVQYSEGWDLISGDTRMAPRLAYSETDTLNLEEYEQTGVGGITGMIDLVAEKKSSNDTVIDPLWKFLLPLTRNVNSMARRGDVPGMWRPIDTIYIERPEHVGPLVSTIWHQHSPYNDKSFNDDGVICPAGCGPIAMSQILYYYLSRSNTHHIQIPSNCMWSNSGIQFSNFSDSQWQNILNDDNAKAVYISYIGHEKLNANYSPSRTGVNFDSDYENAFNWAHLSYSVGSSYNFNIMHILSSIRLQRPVLMRAGDTSKNMNHAFIIDCYSKTSDVFVVRYQWSNDYHPTEDELQRYPSWMFELTPISDGKDENPIYEETYPIYETYSIAMNWGLYGVANNVYYNACQVFYPNGEGDGSLYINQYLPYWNIGDYRFDQITNYYYNIECN